MMDWSIWSLFLLQFIALCLLLFPRDKRVFKVRMEIIVMILLLLVCVGIVLSLLSHATSPLPLHF